MYIADLTIEKPDDWDDETKYPNKELSYVTPENEYKHVFRPSKYVDGKFVEDESQPMQTSYRSMIFESWVYDCPSNPVTGKWSALFVKCPVCGSYHISKSIYNNLCPEMLAGSAGIEYKCDECGFTCRRDQIVS